MHASKHAPNCPKYAHKAFRIQTNSFTLNISNNLIKDYNRTHQLVHLICIIPHCYANQVPSEALPSLSKLPIPPFSLRHPS